MLFWEGIWLLYSGIYQLFKRDAVLVLATENSDNNLFLSRFCRRDASRNVKSFLECIKFFANRMEIDYNQLSSSPPARKWQVKCLNLQQKHNRYGTDKEICGCGIH